MATEQVNPGSGRKSKEAVIHSALKLFNMSGYDGTSVRAIAKDAGVNLALVSYYFGGKQGLLEYLMSAFFEGYLQELEQAERDSASKKDTCDRLVYIADMLITYQQKFFYLSRFCHREMTLDNQLVRELMSSYLMKEKYVLIRLFEKILPDAAMDPSAAEFAVLQYRDLIIMPFLQPQFLREVFFLRPSEPSFRINYLHYISRWAKQLTGQRKETGELRSQPNR
ncbi:TetR/AcrR family transcriptional regulator [Sporolactobacillus shoreae]|uniref:TetR/AcrR family transcriptional regulator n=1 Tax=Sporolactobacillus shoreae TaxID=1465501 RepID=A0A4Z0GPV0_9BACL|nr:forespore capture DNA-binding protein RefZ [Sporolactobacillus shoreae]TGA99237.1 TetR/AcrR family transcriptional regulator [Sporolactobacillus shoreae]